MSAITPIDSAREQAGRIQQELHVAGAELHLTNTALETSLPTAAKQGDVARALLQNARIEGKVQEAAEDLAHVRDLLTEEVAERARLERELAIAKAARK